MLLDFIILIFTLFLGSMVLTMILVDWKYNTISVGTGFLIFLMTVNYTVAIMLFVKILKVV